MPQKSKLNLLPIDLGNKTIGQRIASTRKEQGLTQKELAEKIGLTQGLVSSYENDTRKLTALMIARFAVVLSVTTDQIIGLSDKKQSSKKNNFKITKRMKEIEKLPISKQKFILKTIDELIKAAKEDQK